MTLEIMTWCRVHSVLSRLVSDCSRNTSTDHRPWGKALNGPSTSEIDYLTAAHDVSAKISSCKLQGRTPLTSDLSSTLLASGEKVPSLRFIVLACFCYPTITYQLVEPSTATLS